MHQVLNREIVGIFAKVIDHSFFELLIDLSTSHLRCTLNTTFFLLH